MVTEKQLFGNKYKFKHIKINVEEKDENDNVLVFSAAFVTTTLPGQPMSDGHIEINRTLWDQSSSKRPPGYLVLGASTKKGVMTSYLAATEWCSTVSYDELVRKRAEWKIGVEE